MNIIPLAFAAMAAALPVDPGEPPRVYALLVAASKGGAGQAPLAHAIDDARTMEAVFLELGRTAPERLRTLVDPTPDVVLGAIQGVAAEIAAAGPRQTMFVFYYSGHARAEAIDLGERPLVLDALRAALDKVPATVRVAVLDACQSGAFSKVKGAIPAADFSIRSARRLATEGSAVIASSTGSELSQESPELGGSFFTHHLAVGLRGAADADRDGRVMLREAYEYAYHRTILATAATAVGRQHPVLETRLKGHGDVTLSYPSAASAQLALPGHREPTALLVSTARDVVVAELHAPSDREVQIALPPGEYVAIARRGALRARCELSMVAGRVTQVDPATCPVISERDGAPKGGRLGWSEGWGFELGLGARIPVDDDYVSRLDDFGYASQSVLLQGLRGRVSVVRRVVENASLLLGVGLLDRRSWRRSTVGLDGSQAAQDFDFTVWNAMLSGRLGLELGGGFSTYAQAGAGLAWANSSLGEVRETHVAPSFAVGAGLEFRITSWGSLYLMAGWTTARAISNLAGDTHESGGLDNSFGLRVEL